MDPHLHKTRVLPLLDAARSREPRGREENNKRDPDLF